MTDKDIPAPGGRAALDVASLLDRLDGDRELALEMLRVFSDGLPAQLEALHLALERGDAGGLRFLAHKLKGSAANAGAAALCERAGLLESAAGRGDLEAAAGLAKEVGEAAALALGAIAAAGGGL